MRELIIAWLENTKDLTKIVVSIHTFGAECHNLVSGSFEGFMERVKVTKPIVHDFVTFFGNNYNPETKTIDLTMLPTFARIYGPKIGWKEDRKIAQEVEESRNRVNGIVDKTKTLLNSRLPRLTDRHISRDYSNAVRKLSSELNNFRSTKIVEKELSRNAPSWFVGIVEITEEVQRAFPQLSKTASLSTQRYRPHFPESQTKLRATSITGKHGTKREGR